MALIALVVNLLQPLHSLKICLYELALIGIIVGWAIWFVRHNRKWLYLLAAVIFLPFLPLINQTAKDNIVLQKYYVDYLRSYEGVKYVWGGEGCFGIDCSGLPRSAFIKANFKYAYFHFKGKALRKALWLWWFDASAKEMFNGYKGAMIVEQKFYKIKDLRTDVQPGDIATNGSHVMVYLSASEIIQSDPDRNLVIIDKLPAEIHWYRMDVNLVKWNKDN